MMTRVFEKHTARRFVEIKWDCVLPLNANLALASLLDTFKDFSPLRFRTLCENHS